VALTVDQLLTSTRSARKSLALNASVDLEEIRDCLRIGLHAATGSNQQSWRWLIVTDAGLRQNIAAIYRSTYLAKVGGQLISEFMPTGTPERALMSSTEYLVQHMAEIPVLVIPCYEPYLPRTEGDESFYQATLYGSMFPAVWNFALALRTRGYGTCITTLHLHRESDVGELLGIPDSYVQCALLPVSTLLTDSREPTPRRPLSDVVALNGWNLQEGS
jgi:nitroreductase